MSVASTTTPFFRNPPLNKPKSQVRKCNMSSDTLMSFDPIQITGKTKECTRSDGSMSCLPMDIRDHALLLGREPFRALLQSAERVEMEAVAPFDRGDECLRFVRYEQPAEAEALLAQNFLRRGDAAGLGIFQQRAQRSRTRHADRHGLSDAGPASLRDIAADMLGGKTPLGDDLHAESGGVEKFQLLLQALARVRVGGIALRV